MLAKLFSPGITGNPGIPGMPGIPWNIAGGGPGGGG